MSFIVPSYWIVPLAVYGWFLLLSPWVSPDNPRARWLVIASFGLLTLRYHYFRITETLPPLTLSVSAFAVYGFYVIELSMSVLSWQSTKVMVRRTDRTREVEENLRWYEGAPRLPLVDILIPTYNESLDVLEPTILGARQLDYPRFRVWVLDDSRRDWLEELCKKLGVNYLRRPDNRHFKAGNLNHAIQRLVELDERPDFLAVLDADFIVLPSFLERTLSLMKDPKVAIVQTPQRFYNPDPFQYAFDAGEEWPDDQRAFFEYRLPSLDAEGVATCCGTSFLVRLEPLLEVGGFPLESVSEDTLLSIKLRGLGWRTVYLTEGLSFGLSPEGLGEFLTQRARWWLGSTQTALYRWRAAGSKLAFRKRLIALEALLRCIVLPASRLSWLVVPIVYWFTGFAILQASGEDLISYTMPLWAARMAISWMSNGAILPIVTDATTLLGAPLYLRAAFRAIVGSQNQRFKVTPKGVNRATLTIHWRTLSWVALTALGIAGGVCYRAFNPRLTLSSSRFFLWNLYSTCTTLVVLFVALTPCFEKPKHRRAERFRYGEAVRIIHGERVSQGTALDISLGGARVTGVRSPEVGETVNVELQQGLSVPARVVRTLGEESFAVEFAATTAQKSELIALVFYSRRYIAEPSSWSFWRCGAAMLRRVVA